MRNSLLFKLLGAFLLVTLLGSLLIFIMVSWSTQSAFNIYSTRSGQAWAERLAPLLAEYYAAQGNWTGVENIIQSEAALTGSGGVHGMGNGPNAGQGMGAGRGMAAGSMAGSGQRVILADPSGVVFVDSHSELLGKQLSDNELKNGAAVTLNEKVIATVLVTPNEFAGTFSPAAEFLTSVNRSILIAAGVAGVVALLLGAFLFFQITAPLRQLKDASLAIAQGDLSRRVDIRSNDELGDVGGMFNHMADSLVKSEEQRHNMVADIAHELRTPLTVMRANLEGFMDEVLPLDMEHTRALYSETLLLNRLVDDLRLLSLVEAGELKLECGPTDLAALLGQVVKRLQPQAAQKGLILEGDIAGALPSVWADPDRLTQVINNLTANAMRYTPEGGQIIISLTRSTDQAKTLLLSVTDSGTGIDPQALPYVFERFHRADKSRARTSGGSGLGLAIVKQLVEAHGGKIEALSPVFLDADGRRYGTRFVVSLPVYQG